MVPRNLRASSPAAPADDDDASAELAVESELLPALAVNHGDTVTLAGEDGNAFNDDATDDLLALIGSRSPKDRFNERTGFTRIHLGVARDAARRIKHAVDVKKQVNVRIRRDLSIDDDALYSDISWVDIEYYIWDMWNGITGNLRWSMQQANGWLLSSQLVHCQPTDWNAAA